MLRAIAFDLWETLITEKAESPRALERMRLANIERILAGRGVVTTRERTEDAYRHVWHRCQELYWSRDVDVPCRAQIGHFLEALKLEPFDEPTMLALEHAYANAALEILPTLVPGAEEVAPELKRRGYLLGLISNTGRTPGSALRSILQSLGIAHFLDAMIYSNEHGYCKPQRSIFEELRHSLGVEFEEMLFVGDNLYVDVYGAQQCGMSAVHFVPHMRGTAVAPPVTHDLVIEPDATISDLRQLLEIVVAPHPASGHPLPASRGEGSRGRSLSRLRERLPRSGGCGRLNAPAPSEAAQIHKR